jgi:hypothetical protein
MGADSNIEHVVIVRIDDAFRRDAGIGASCITVEGGEEVILKAAVRSWPESREANRLARARRDLTNIGAGS